MTATVHQLQPPALDPAPAPVAAEVRAAARAGAVALRILTGLAVRLRQRGDGRVASALVDSPRHLEVAAGHFPVVPRLVGRDLSISELLARDIARRALSVEVTADAAWLRYPQEATRGSFGAAYAASEHPDADGALAWIRERVLPAPEPILSAEDAARWRAETVRPLAPGEDLRPVLARMGLPVVPDADGRVQLPLYDAVFRVYGPMYEGGVDAEVLARDHGLAVGDAERIAAAVLKIARRQR